jgi:hypothetical protein
MMMMMITTTTTMMMTMMMMTMTMTTTTMTLTMILAGTWSSPVLSSLRLKRDEALPPAEGTHFSSADSCLVSVIFSADARVQASGFSSDTHLP